MSNKPSSTAHEKRPRQYAAEYVGIKFKAERRQYWERVPGHLKPMARHYIEAWKRERVKPW